MPTAPQTGAILLEEAQAQKHVTANEAILDLDAVVQLAVIDKDIATAPGNPSDGDRYIIAGTGGAWSGGTLSDGSTAIAIGDVAHYRDGGWVFYRPRIGWLAWVEDEGELYVFSDSSSPPAWIALLGVGAFSLLGVNATADTTNRLSVTAPAALFNAEVDDFQFKVNKAATGDTASFLFQTGFAGRAEIGLTGDDDFSFKVYAGGSWLTGIKIDQATGNALLGGAWNDPHLVIGSSHLWVDATGDLRIKSSAPSSDTDGDAAVTDSYLETANVSVSGDWTISGDWTYTVNLTLQTTADNGNDREIVFQKARGGSGGPSVITANDSLGTIRFQGYDGNNYVDGASLSVQAKAATGNLDGVLTIITNGSDALVIDENQNADFKGDASISGALTVSERSTFSGGVGTVATGNPAPDASNGILLSSANFISAYRANDICGAWGRNGTGAIFQFFSQSGIVGSIAINSAGTGIDYNTSSDYRLKQDVDDLTADEVALRFGQLRPVSFKWKKNDTPDWGFLAHEVQEHFPSLVTGEKDGDEMQMVNAASPAILAALVKLVQDLRERVSKLEE